MRRLTGALVVLSCLAFAACAGSTTGSTHSGPIAYPQVCQSDASFMPLPGTLTAQVQGQPATQFHRGKPFTLIFRPQDGVSFTPYTNVGIAAVPYFNGALHEDTANKEEVTLTNQDEQHGSLMIPVTFPFAQPTVAGYTKAQFYCFEVGIQWQQEDGTTTYGNGYIGMEVLPS